MKKFFKIFGITFGVLVLLIIAAAVIIPNVVDVDKYRPQITQAANEKLNGKLELGKLSLSLWGQIRVQVQGLSLADTSGRKVVSVKDAYIHVPFLKILTGSPELVFNMDRPEVLVIKYKSGKLNLMGLMKEQPKEAAQTPPAGQPGAPQKGESKVEVPGIVARARLGIEMRNALVHYKDEATGMDTQIKDLNLVMRNLSLSHKMDIEMWADLNTQMGKTFSVVGPARLKAHAKPSVVNGVFDHAEVDANVDLDGLQMTAPDLFEKKKGVAANADLVMTVSPKEAKISKFDLKFFNAEIKANGAVTNLGAEPAKPGAAAPSPVVDMKVVSNDIELKAWNELVPMLKQYELGGTARLDVNAKGPSDKLGYTGKFVVNGLTAKAPNLKAQPRLDVLVELATDQIQNLLVTMKAPGNDMQLKGKLVNFAKPQGSFDLTSPGMDLDQLINWPPPAEKTAQTGKPVAGGEKASAPKGGKAKEEDLDASVDSLRTNPAAAVATVVVNTNIKMLKAKNIKMTDLVGKLYLRDLVAGLDGFSMKLWGGTIKANFASQLKPKTPTYTFSSVMDALDLHQAVAANVEMFKNTVVGKAHFEMNGSGASFNTEPAKANLKARGSMKIENASFGTIDVAKMASDAINKAIESVAAKVPGLKGKTVGIPGGKGSKYDLISSDFTIADGKFDAPNFNAKAAPNQGIDLKGNTQVGLIDMSLKTRWEVIDTYNLLKAKDISVNVSGTEVPHILAEGNGPVKFVVNAGCTVMQPCYSYTEVPEYLGKVALNNVASAAAGRAKSEVMKALPKNVPPGASKALEGLGNKLFKR